MPDRCVGDEIWAPTSAHRTRGACVQCDLCLFMPWFMHIYYNMRSHFICPYYLQHAAHLLNRHRHQQIDPWTTKTFVTLHQDSSHFGTSISFCDSIVILFWLFPSLSWNIPIWILLQLGVGGPLHRLHRLYLQRKVPSFSLLFVRVSLLAGMNELCAHGCS